MIKIITFYIGVDVLGFPLIHQHKLVYEEKFYNKFIESKYVGGVDPYNNNPEVLIYHRKQMKK